jgi:hypothetical protein
MSVWATSMLTANEVKKMVLEKYQIESEQDKFGLFVVKDTGGKQTGEFL